jgi:hypothetical protein
MGTITTRLLITGTAVTSDPIAVNYSKVSTVVTPVIESASVDVTPSGVRIVTAGSGAGGGPATTRTFVYIKCTNDVSQVSPVLVSLTAATDAMILQRDEFLYIPIKPGQTVTLSVAAEATGQAEYGFFSA